jgi:protein SCO1/2
MRTLRNPRPGWASEATTSSPTPGAEAGAGSGAGNNDACLRCPSPRYAGRGWREAPGEGRVLRIRAAILLAAAVLLINAAPPPDVALTDETGRPVHFYADIAKDKTVAVNFIFTSCSTICQPMSGTFAKAETLLGKRNARLVSISIDPETDTPQKLAAWKKRFRGGASWTLLTGPQEEIDKLRKSLGVFTPDRINHTPMVVVFNKTSGKTTRVNGLTSAQAIIDAIDSVTPSAEDRSRAMYMNGPRNVAEGGRGSNTRVVRGDDGGDFEE